MYTNVFLIVVLFGAGTDYCLFLISRFREEMTGATVAVPAVKTTVRAVGETIASSAGTVIVGLAMMVFAELNLYNTSGPSIAIGVIITLLAGLTLIPALLSILGHRAFWPRKAHPLKDSGLWPSWATRVVKRPVVALVVPVIVLVPLAVYGSGLPRDFDLLGDLPAEDEAKEGFDILAQHFGPGELQPLNVVALDPSGYDTPKGLARAVELEADIAELDNVSVIRSFYGSLPDKDTLSVADQLRVAAEAVREGIETLSSGTLPTSSAGVQSAAQELAGVGGYLLRNLGFDMAPIILGFVLGKVMEVNLRNALAISGGEISILFSSVLSIILWIMAVAIVILPWLIRRIQAQKAVSANA
jgi:RND superfamily putative drug exporter